MTNFLHQAAAAVRNAFTTDVKTDRFLEKTYVDVRRTAATGVRKSRGLPNPRSLIATT